MHHTVYAAGASKAVDVAIKSARRLTGRRKIVAIASGYRGRTGLSGAAVILETMPATYGFPLPSDGYLPGVPGLCREFGALYIADEVQTGLGRTGCVWGVDAWGVEPDILVTGKGQVMGLVFDAPAGGVQMMSALHRHGVWATFAGHDRPVLQFKPGLFVDRACCDEALTRFEAALRVARRQR